LTCWNKIPKLLTRLYNVAGAFVPM
jgi:hypothetical protein